MANSLLVRLLSFSFGKKNFQSFYQKLFHLSLKGMNFGQVGSGEERVLLDTLKNTKSPVIFDVGANIGQYSTMAQAILKTPGTVYAFEPSKPNFDILTQNVQQYPDIRCFNQGLGNKNEQVKLYKDQESTTLASVYQRNINNQEFNQFEIIHLVTLDSFCEEYTISAIDFLKIDVEGNELNVLKGATDSLSSGKIKNIQFEFGGADIDSRVFFRDFWEILSPKYHIFRILADGLAPIKVYDEKLEIFTYVNYFAKLKK